MMPSQHITTGHLIVTEVPANLIGRRYSSSTVMCRVFSADISAVELLHAFLAAITVEVITSTPLIMLSASIGLHRSS